MNKEIKKLGRPVNENSKRQQELKLKAEARALGLISRGRPKVEGSKNQEKLKRREELKALGLLSGKKGRPVSPNSARQERLASLEMKRQNGTLKLGRPKKVVTE